MRSILQIFLRRCSDGEFWIEHEHENISSKTSKQHKRPTKNLATNLKVVCDPFLCRDPHSGTRGSVHLSKHTYIRRNQYYNVQGPANDPNGYDTPSNREFPLAPATLPTVFSYQTIRADDLCKELRHNDNPRPGGSIPDSWTWILQGRVDVFHFQTFRTRPRWAHPGISAFYGPA